MEAVSGRKAARILSTFRRSEAPGAPLRKMGSSEAPPWRAFACMRVRSDTLELRRSLLQERERALCEVLGRGLLLLDRGLQFQLLVQPAVQPRVELALGAGVAARRAGGELRGERVAGLLQLAVGVDGVDEAPVERLGRGEPLAEHRQLGGPRQA